MTTYRCPFCKMEIPDGIDALREHRKEGGDCDKITTKQYLERWTAYYESKFDEWAGRNFDPEAKKRWVLSKLREDGFDV